MLGKKHNYMIEEPPSARTLMRENPKEESDMLEGKTSSGLTTVRSNRVGTTREVFDHGSTTHVDCETSAKGTCEPSMDMKGIENDYPWYSLRNIKEWIEFEFPRML